MSDGSLSGSCKSVVRLVPFLPLCLATLLLVLVLASEQASAHIASMLFAHVDRGLTVTSLLPYVTVTVGIGTLGMPYGLLLFGAGFLFGFWGGVAACFLIELSCASLCFVLGRYFLRARCRTWYETMAVPMQVKVAVSKFERNELQNLILFRIIPFPGALKNYLPPLMNISFFTNALAVCVEVTAYAPWFAYVGAKSEGMAREYAQSHALLGASAPVMRPLPAEVWPALATSAAIFGVLVTAASREFSDPKDLGEDLGTVLSPLAEPPQVGQHEMRPFREYQRL